MKRLLDVGIGLLSIVALAWIALAIASQDAQVHAQPFLPALPGTFNDITTPSNPGTGKTKVYTKAGTACALSPTGTETCTGSGGGGTTVTFAAPLVTAGANVFGPQWAMVAPPTAGWTTINSATFDTTNGYPFISSAPGAGVNFRGATRLIPGAAPWTVYLAVLNNPAGNAFATLCQGGSECGGSFGFSDGTKYLTTILGTVASTCSLYVSRLTNVTTISSNPYASGNTTNCQFLTNPTFWRLRDDGTNISIAYAMDGVNSAAHWSQVYSETETAFLATAPTVVFVGSYTNGAGDRIAVISYQGTTP